MKKVISRIKTIFPLDVLRYIAAICDTRRIESNNEKMIVLCDLLYSNNIKFEILGGATNRIALQIDGYAVKFAMDEQGYLDNLIEYSLSPELQPFVTKSYETNGYIQVQECVEVMTKETFKVYRAEINKVLDSLCQDYLLGDVGYIDKNRTNWGVRSGKPVILDYAYCHRATENLFTCSKCGAPLTYDSTYDKLVCTDRSMCRTVYTYNERKRIQGKQVDEDMVKERKTQSICLPGDEVSKDIEMFEDRLVGDNYFIIDSPEDMHNYNKLKERSNMKVLINGGDDDMTTLEDRLAAMVMLAKNPNDARAKEIIDAEDDYEMDIPEAIYTDRYQDNFMDDSNIGIRLYKLSPSRNDDEYYEDIDDDDDDQYDDDSYFNADDALAMLVNQIRDERQREYEEFNKRAMSQEEKYMEACKEKYGLIDEEPADDHVDTVDEPESVESTEESVEETLKRLHSDQDIDVESTNPEDAAILVNGKPLPIGEEIVL